MRFDCAPRFTGSGLWAEPTDDQIKNTPALWNASIEDALKYGGDLTREAIGAMRLRGDRRSIIVDTKIHMLMPGFMPAIPGWHTDGAPRAADGNPGAKGAPDLAMQRYIEERAAKTSKPTATVLDWDIDGSPYPDLDVFGRPPQYHLLVTGSHCSTLFLDGSIDLDLPEGTPARDFYKQVSGQVGRDTAVPRKASPASEVVEFGWWDIHTAVAASTFGWRFLIRVTETDWLTPQRDLRQVMRAQQQVYVPLEFGW